MMWMIRSLILAWGLTFGPQAIAAEAPGDWSGTLEIGSQVKLSIVVHIKADESSKLQGTLDSPDQGAFGIPLQDVVATADSLAFLVPAVAGRYEAKWDQARKAWVGQWSQGGPSLPLVLTATAPGRSVPQLPADWSIPSDDAIGNLLATRIADRPGAGIVAGVLEASGRRVIARGPAARTGFGGDTIFEIGSMTKVFTALLLADMAQRGEVGLDDPAEKYLPAGATMPERAGRKITLVDLATHRSGLPRLPENLPMADPDDPYADYTESQLLEFLAQHKLTRDIGSQYEYSTLGMGLLGYLLARKAGTDYESLLKSRITGPLGMKDTAITLTPEQKSRFATGHDAYMRPAKPWHLPVLAGAGALRSTADDLLTFLDAFVRGADTPLARAMKSMFAKLWPSADQRFDTALGWMVAKSPAGDIVMHDGGTGGFRTSMAYDPVKKRGVVVLSNAAAEPSVNDLSVHLLVGSPLAPLRPIPAAPPPPIKRIAISLPAAEMDRVVGRYALPNQMELSVVRNDQGLTAQISGQPRLPIFAEAPLRFFWRAVDAQLRFIANEEGKVTGAVLTQNGADLNATRLP
jgi:serine-type D-Ala-D-Ala carboxypeptidase/endopeptidase